MSMIQVEVSRKWQEAQDIVAFELVRKDGSPLPLFGAGAHIDVFLPGGIVRQYSLYGDESDRNCYRIAVLRDPQSRGGSVAMHDLVNQGDLIQIGAPRNLFPLVRAERTVLFAGGIGITPLLSMARRLKKQNADFLLHYCVRSLDRAALRQEIEVSLTESQVCFHCDDGPLDQVLDVAQALGPPNPSTHVYVCGPQGFIHHVISTAEHLGWPDAHLHVEYFGAVQKDSSADTGFRVQIASTGALFDVLENQTVVEALKLNGIEIPVACEQGVCGTCITGVLEGECDHRDIYFTDEEKAKHNQFTPCCSRAKSPVLVLDI